MKDKNLSIETEKIQKSEFFNLKNDFSFKAKKFIKIEDLDTIKALLKHRIKWEKWGTGTDY